MTDSNDARSQESEARIHVVPYDSAWPSLFAQEQSLLRRELRKWLSGPIEHVGSTAIPGLAAKPVIDIMAGVESLAASQGAIAAASRLGYGYFPYKSGVMHWFCKPSPAFRTHHLHLVPLDSPAWRDSLAFRDYVRANPAVAAEYAALKLRLATEYEFDREAYTEAKGPFIKRVLDLARSAETNH
jgi:GrpB-like predicted nucleotidyltransferase (UPF0157 family)